jgi:uncharacterized membrane protein
MEVEFALRMHPSPISAAFEEFAQNGVRREKVPEKSGGARRTLCAQDRIVFLDWLRGLAALIMLQGHTFHSFLRPEEREGPAFYLSILLGGQAAAIFLFLTGITYGLGMNRREHLSPGRRVLSALERARYLFLLAVLFRLQTWSFSWPHAPWTDLLHVDVLNLMGATAALLALLALVSGTRRFRWAAASGIVFAFAAPLMAGSVFARLPQALRGYLVPSADGFSMFPWGAFLAFGVAAGSVIPLVERKSWPRVMQWAAMVGFGVLAAGEYFGNLPYSVYAHSDFWLNSPALIACKMGNTILLGAASFLWTEYFSAGWSWVRLLGVNSLAVYWVHVELVYGRWFNAYKQKLTAWECVATSAALILLMTGMSAAIMRVRRVGRAASPIPAEIPALHKPAVPASLREETRSRSRVSSTNRQQSA